MNNDFNEKNYSRKMPTGGVDNVRVNFILKNIPDNNLKILDLGCWDGSYAIRYKKKTNIVYGIESSVTSAKKAKKKEIIVEQGDFMKNSFFKNIRFDIIVAGEIIEHVFDTDLFLQKIKKLLKSHGKLILTTPNVASLPRRILLLFGKNPLLDNRVIIGNTAGHIRYFTFTDTYKILEDNGFRVIKSCSDVLNFNNKGTLYSKFIPKIYKRFGRIIMIYAENIN